MGYGISLQKIELSRVSFILKGVRDLFRATRFLWIFVDFLLAKSFLQKVHETFLGVKWPSVEIYKDFLRPSLIFAVAPDGRRFQMAHLP